MDIKRILKYFLVIFLICFAGYLAYTLIMGNIAKNKDEQVFCAVKCNYSQYSYLWEFSGEDITKGFTTKDECLHYCSQEREGFVYRAISEYSASILYSPFMNYIFKSTWLNRLSK